MVLRKLLDHLSVKDVTLVCQDWGGLTGLSVVKDCPQVFSNLVVMNTGLPAPVLDLSDNNEGDQGMMLGAKIQGVHTVMYSTVQYSTVHYWDWV